jgi:hypothetical protein
MALENTNPRKGNTKSKRITTKKPGQQTDNADKDIKFVNTHTSVSSDKGKAPRIMDFPSEVIQNILGHCDIRTVAHFERVSRATKTITASLVGYDKFKEFLPTVLRRIKSYQREVSRSKEHRRWEMPLDLTCWIYGDAIVSYAKTDGCVQCRNSGMPAFEFPLNEGLINATDGIRVCWNHMHDTHEYRLALDCSGMNANTKKDVSGLPLMSSSLQYLTIRMNSFSRLWA